jgi:hypothetical protein
MAKKSSTHPDKPAHSGDLQLKVTVFTQLGFAILQVIAALAVLAAYGLSMWVMFKYRGDPHWDRMVYLFTGFEAIVFAAAGLIFGTRIQRASVEAAHEQSRQAHEDLNAARKRADRADELEEATANYIKALRAYEGGQSQSAGNGQASYDSPDLIGPRGNDGDTVPKNDNSRPSFALKLAEEFFPQGRW